MSDGFHGVAQGEGVHFGIALWPYDLLLRFGYDLPENEHTWDGKWFDDVFEAAAFDLRTTAAKLLLTLRRVHRTTGWLREAVETEIPPARLAHARKTAERTPLHIDLANAYLRRLGDGLAAVIPGCHGQDGRVLMDGRASLATLRIAPALPTLDARLAELLASAPGALLGEPQPLAHSATLYVVAGAAGYASALPRAAARALRGSGEATLAASAALCASTTEAARWLDALLTHLQGVVAERSEPGAELLERWAARDWSLLLREPEGLGAFLPMLE